MLSHTDKFSLFRMVIMYIIDFSDDIVQELDHHLASERDAKIYKRLQCLNLKKRGYNHDQISSILGVSQNTITEWLKLFMEHGFEGLSTLCYEGRRISKLEPYRNKIKEHIEKEMVPTLGALQHWLKEKFEVEVEQSWLSRWLKKNSIFLIKSQNMFRVKRRM